MYTLIERPIEPQAGLPHCRECHIVLLAHAGTRPRLRQQSLHELSRRPRAQPAVRTLRPQDQVRSGHRSSRYACSVRIEKWMNEMPFTIGNVTVDDSSTKGEWWENGPVNPNEMTPSSSR